MTKIPLTPKGLGKLEAELKELKQVKRPAVITAISEARALGDLSENAEYHAAKEQQGFIERRISYLEGVIGSADVIDPAKVACDTVKFGALCTVLDEESGEEKSYRIVGREEADIGAGMIALDSPLARALIGRSRGERFSFQSPRGARDFELLKIDYE
jgi:transcription elongation factor GreA